MTSTLTHTMVQPRGVPTLSTTEMDAQRRETAATLVDVALNAKVHTPELPHVTAPSFPASVVPPHESVSSAVQTLSTSIGLGIDPSLNLEQKNATEAALKAVRDAMERGVLGGTARGTNANLQIRVKLGVPGTQGQPLQVDLSRLAELLPAFPLLPVQVELGGLLVTLGDASTAVCTVVACITIEQHTSATQPSMTNMMVAATSPTSVASPASPPSHRTISDNDDHGVVEHVKTVTAATNTATMPLDEPCLPSSTNNTPLTSSMRRKLPMVHRSTSIDMLARISAEIHEQQPHVSNTSMQGPASAALALANKEDFHDHEDQHANNYYYKKLPPGMTPKNNKRLFVKHNYRDHSHEAPRPDELDLMGPNAPLLTPNAAFPLKLHETLTHIELDGHDDIIGWLPHGRSFKIHKQKEFVEIILPRYFVMTKKSSFLRQLNLYCFNRLSGVGADQGSYYHEKFLRGMKYLARRMSRQKVNGNGIRAAGNPDEEPDLSQFPVCPPSPVQALMHENGVVPTKYVSVGPTSKREPLDANKDPILRSTAGIQVSFPLKLQRILDKLEAEGKTDIMSWQPHGRAFLVHDSDRLVSELLPVYFNQSRYSSFQRQLHMYQFQRITTGQDKGAYWHPNFQRGRPQLSLKMQRTRVNGRGTRRPGNPLSEPDLYSYEALPTIARGTRVEIPVDLPHAADDDGESASGESA